MHILKFCFNDKVPWVIEHRFLSCCKHANDQMWWTACTRAWTVPARQGSNPWFGFRVEVVLLTSTLSGCMAGACPSVLSRAPGSSLPITRAAPDDLSSTLVLDSSGEWVWLSHLPAWPHLCRSPSLPTHFLPFLNMAWFLQSPCLSADSTLCPKYPSFDSPRILYSHPSEPHF